MSIELQCATNDHEDREEGSDTRPNIGFEWGVGINAGRCICRPVISAIWRCSAPAGGFVKMQRAGCETPMCAYTTHRLKNASTTHSAFLISKSTLRLCFYCSPLAFIPRVTGKFNVLFSNKLSALCKSGVSIWFLHSPLHYTEVKPEMPTSYRNTESIRWIMEKVNKSTTHGHSSSHYHFQRKLV